MVSAVVQYRSKAQGGQAATEAREAFGVRGACSRFRTAPRHPIAPASWTHSKRFAWQFAASGWLAIACITLAAAAQAAQVGSSPKTPPAPLAYEMSAYELAPQLQPKAQPWRARSLKSAILERVAREEQRRELDVDYYRIGYTMGYPLPLARRPSLKELPAALPGRAYPWLIWLSWDLEERWRLLQAGWRQFGDLEAGALLQQELAALSGWDHFSEVDGNVGLVTGHLAASLSLGLADSSKWEKQSLRQARVAAKALIERDVWPWFETHWRVENIGPNQLANIPVIALVRSTQLARVIGSPRQAALDAKARLVFQAWCRLRTGEAHHTEGAAYDGYLMDSITEWLAGLPDRAELLRDGHDAFRSLADQWMDLSLPGRPDLEAPLGDVEPEMTFWATALVRIGGWYEWRDVDWFLHRFPLQRMRADGLVCAYGQKVPTSTDAPVAGPQEHPNALSLRTGWDKGDVLAVMGLSRGPMSHLHPDGGQLILGWQGRFWITDPGYQQYRPGDERDYTLGLQAHNAPVIGGTAQTLRASRVLLLETNAHGWQHARVELSGCYRGLPKGASVQRELWLINEGGLAMVARDSFDSLGKDVEVSTSWQGGHHLAWAFREGWTRLSDGQHAVWMGTVPGTLEASGLTRHVGTRGPLTLTQTATLPEGKGARWWVFWCDPQAGWTPPAVEVRQGALEFKAPGASQGGWSISMAD